MTDELVEFLGKVSLFSQISDDDLGHIARSGSDFRFSGGDLICSRGDSGKSMFIITSGIVEVFVEADGEHQILSHLHRGDYFGEMSLLSGLPRSASVRALGETRVFGLTKESFEALCRENVDIALEIIRTLSVRLAASNLTASSFEKARVFVTLSTEEMIGTAQLSSALSVALGRENKGFVTLYDPNLDNVCHADIFNVKERVDIAFQLLSSGQLRLDDTLVKVDENISIIPPQSKGGAVIQEFHHHIPFHALCEKSDYIVVDSSSTIAAVNREIINTAEVVILVIPAHSDGISELLSQFDRMVLTPAGVDVSKVRIVLANHVEGEKLNIPSDLERRVTVLPPPPGKLDFDESFFESEYGLKVKRLALGLLSESYVELCIPLVGEMDLDYISGKLDKIKECCPEMVKRKTLSNLSDITGSKDDTGSFVMVEGVFSASELREKMGVLVKSVEELKERLGSDVLFLKIDGRVTSI